ncbi:MAG: rhodanese-like domain-containing protein [bacterium]|nr:rhodanese-like domain-containing protein [bacterium]
MIKILNKAAILASIVFFSSCGNSAPVQEKNHTDGEIINGLRYLSIKDGEAISLKVFRGDYIVPQLKGTSEYTVTVPGLKKEKKYPVKKGEKEYIKMKKAGTFAITAGSNKGSIEVIEYNQPYYKAVKSKEAVEIIKNVNPLILDVRTPMEFNRYHIKNARLIPVRVLQQQIESLNKYKERDIVIYCATGNRSTVASKILIDAGFKKIYNVRYGIVEWMRAGNPVEK